MSRDEYTKPVIENYLAELENLTRVRSVRQAQKHLSPFIQQAWPIIEPGRQYMHNWHIDAVAEHLEATLAGDIKRLIVNIPPRAMKSIACTVMFPAWCWTKNPALRFITASYSQSLSIKHSLDRRAIIESDWYQAAWKKVRMAADQNMKMEFQNTEKGVMFATSIGGTVTGKGGDFLILDDPLSPKEALSETERASTWSFISQTLLNRLDVPKEGRIICVMQRLHEEDPTGKFIEQGGWTHLKIPVEAPSRKKYVLPMTGRVIIRKAGELLWSERWGKPELVQSKRDLGSYGYAGQMMQEPAPAEGGMLQRAWFAKALYGLMTKEWETAARAIASTADGVILSVDATFKDSDGTDFVSIQVWAYKRSHKYLLDMVTERMGFTATQAAIISMVAKWSIDGLKLIEDKANGPAVIETLRDIVPGIKAIEPQGGKIARASAASPDIEAGNVHLPAHAPFTEDLIQQCALFPNGTHDDMVDGMTQAIIFLNKRPGLLDFYRAQAEAIRARQKDANIIPGINGGVTVESTLTGEAAVRDLNRLPDDMELDDEALDALAEMDALDAEIERMMADDGDMTGDAKTVDDLPEA
jgi:predicted phage terminase large subunit-like protein